MRLYFYLFLAPIMLFIFVNSSVAEEYYRYIDENGTVLFTDDLSKIPKEQRDNIDIKKGTTPENSQLPSKDKSENTNIETDKSNNNTALASEAEELKAIKQALDNEYEAIGSENTKLSKLTKNLKDNKSIEAYNLEVKKINERTKAYQIKQSIYLKRANAYNSALKKDQE